MTENTTGGELVTYQPADVARRDMRNPVTDSWTEVVRATSILAEQICQTEFVPAGLRGSSAKVTAAMLYGRELGLPPMTGLGSVHVINGKAGISAEQMRALVLQSGHEIQFHESSSVRCVLRGRRRGADEWTTVEYTMGEAQKAGDAKKNPNYQTRPAEMLLARATTRLCRMIFPDVIHGMRSSEELEDMAEPEIVTDRSTGEVTVAQPDRSVRRQTRREQPRATTTTVEVGERQETAQGSSGRPLHAETTTAPTSDDTAEQPTARTVRRETRREAPRGRTERPSTTDDGEASGAGPEGESSPGEEGSPADDRGIEPAEPSPGETTPSAGLKITPEQRGTIHGHMKRLEVEDRAERLYWTAVAAGRGEVPVESSSDLTREEASDAIDRLGRLRDRAALEAMGAALGEDKAGQ